MAVDTKSEDQEKEIGQKKEKEYGMPAHVIFPEIDQRQKDYEEWVQRSKRPSGLVGQSKPRF